MVKPFVEVTARTQVDRLRRLAAKALPAWGLPQASLTLLNHGYNTTFRVNLPDGRRYALRVNTQPHKTAAHLRAELAWLTALSAQTPLRVPTPQPTITGSLCAVVPSRDHGRDLPLVLFSWLPGPNLGERWTTTQAYAVGAAMARLHDHAAAWTMPADADLPLFGDVLTDLPNRLADHPALDAEARQVLTAAYRRAQRLQDEAFAGATPIPLHADLHGDNLKWHDGRLAVFDFDDAGLGVPALDVAISTYYLRDDARAEQALLAGYASVRTLPSVTAEQFEAMVAGRNLLLVNDLIEQPNADLRAIVPGYVATSVARVRHWLNTGRFRRDPDAEPVAAG